MSDITTASTSNKDTAAYSTFPESAVRSDLGFWRTMFSLNALKEERCVPAIVEGEVDAEGLVTVRPLVKRAKRLFAGYSHYDRGQVRVRPYQICQGGFKVSIPVFNGDTGLLFAGDRDAKTAVAKNAKELKESQDGYKDGSGNEGPQPVDSFGVNQFMYGYFLPCNFGNRGCDSGNGDFVLANLMSDESVSFGKDGLIYTGKVDRTFEVVTATRYDKESHQLQQKTLPMGQRGSFIVKVGEESGWKMIDGGQAVPLSDEM